MSEGRALVNALWAANGNNLVHIFGIIEASFKGYIARMAHLANALATNGALAPIATAALSNL